MYRGFSPRCIFFAQFLKKTREKIHFFLFFGVSNARRFNPFPYSELVRICTGLTGCKRCGKSGRHFSTVRRIFSRQKCARMSARSARDSIMRPPRHQESRIKRSARLLLPASASIVESRRTCRTREGNPLARLNIPSASPGMTIPASRASCRSLRPLTRSTTP